MKDKSFWNKNTDSTPKENSKNKLLFDENSIYIIPTNKEKPVKIVYESCQPCPILFQTGRDVICKNAIWEDGEDMNISLKCSVGVENCDRFIFKFEKRGEKDA